MHIIIFFCPDHYLARFARKTKYLDKKSDYFFLRYEIYLTLLIMSYNIQISVDNVWCHIFVFFYVQAPTLKMTKDLVFPTKKWAKFSAWWAKKSP